MILNNIKDKKIFLKLVDAIQLSQRNDFFYSMLSDNLNGNSLKSISDNGVDFYLVFFYMAPDTRNIFYISQNRLEYYEINDESSISTTTYFDDFVIKRDMRKTEFVTLVNERLGENSQKKTLTNPQKLEQLVGLYLASKQEIEPLLNEVPNLTMN